MRELTLAFFFPASGGVPPNLPILIALVYLPSEPVPDPSQPNGSLSQNPSSPPPDQKMYLGLARRTTSARGVAPCPIPNSRFMQDGESNESEGGGAWRRRISSPVGVGALREARVGAAEEEAAAEDAEGRRRGEARTGARREGVR